MPDLWPWYAAAAAGALHGLHPAGGWAVAALWGLRRGPQRVPMGKAHGALLALTAAAFVAGAVHDAGLSMAPLLWGLCGAAVAGGRLPATGSLAQAVSLVVVHVAAWGAVSLGLAAVMRWAVSGWRAGQPAPAP